MAENLLEGALGEEPEAEEAAPDVAAIAPVDQTANILALGRRGKGAAVDKETVAYLRDQRGMLVKQGRMLDIQMEHLHEQRRLNLAHLRVRGWRDGLQLAFQLALAIVGGAFVVALAVMFYDAFTSRSVVVDAFKAPSALASRGLTGDVVASGVLDGLQRLQAATRSASKGLTTKSAWSSDVKIEVPETGVSIGEINRLLHERFGHDLHVDGDLVQTDTGGLALTVRGDGVPAKTFAGAPGDLDKLTTQAAEYVYGRSQPFQFATYLVGANRNTDALAFIPGAFARAQTDDERAHLANSWGNALVGMNLSAQALEKHRLAIALEPGYWNPRGNIVSETALAAGEEAGWRESKAFLRAVAAAPKKDRPDLSLWTNAAELTWDLPLYLQTLLADSAHNGGAGATNVIDAPGIADAYAMMHDPDHAARYMASSDPDDPATKAQVLLMQGYAALDRGDGAAAVPPLQSFWTAWLADPSLQSLYIDYGCLPGLAYGLAGRLAEAEAVFKRAGSWSRCYAFHGVALEHAGDLAGAQRVWAEGLRVGPDLPFVYLYRGQSEMNRGELQAAGADLAAASRRAPHLADPLKAWGDLLAREGRWKDAVAKYDEALKYAPAWTELHQARDEAAKRAG